MLDKKQAEEKYAKPFSEMVAALPPEQQAEVRDFIECLLARQPARPRCQPRFGRGGALTELRDEFTSVDLQHECAGTLGRKRR